MLRPRLRLAAMVLAVSVGVAQAQPTELSPENMVRYTVLMLEKGQPAQALRFSDALLRRDPNDAKALVLKSRAQRDLGQYSAATATGRLAWRHADTGGERFDAAMAVAQGLSSDGAKFRAQYWLRRAMQEAPNPAARRMAERDFRYVRNRSRLSVRLDFSVRPSDNVNGGTSADTLDFYGIPLTVSPDAKALSGVQTLAAVTARWRLLEDERSKTDLRFGLVQQLTTLSNKAKRDAPMAHGSDYAYSAVETGIDQAWKTLGGELTASATLGHNWYGGADMSNYGRLDLGFARGLAPGLTGITRLSLERQRREDVEARSATISELSFGVQKSLKNRDRLMLMLTARDSRSNASEIDHNAFRAEIDWTRAQPIWGAGLSLGLSAETRDYSRSLYDASGREDLRLSAEASLALNKISYMGFVPVISVQAQHVNSNVSIYESQSLGIGVTVRSRF